mgnify:CR=1 FL=1
MSRFFELMKYNSMRYAAWEKEISDNMLKSRKKMLILLILLLPAAAISLCGADIMLGGTTSYAPASYSFPVFLASIAIGFCAGLFGGVLGVGGGFIITPALMTLGIKGILAVGTSLFYIFISAVMGTFIHRKLGNTSVKLAIAFMVGSGIGTIIGGNINKALYNRDPVLSDAFISVLYVIMLGFIGSYAVYDFLTRFASMKAENGAKPDNGRYVSSQMTP